MTHSFFFKYKIMYYLCISLSETFFFFFTVFTHLCSAIHVLCFISLSARDRLFAAWAPPLPTFRFFCFLLFRLLHLFIITLEGRIVAIFLDSTVSSSLALVFEEVRQHPFQWLDISVRQREGEQWRL